MAETDERERKTYGERRRRPEDLQAGFEGMVFDVDEQDPRDGEEDPVSAKKVEDFDNRPF